MHNACWQNGTFMLQRRITVSVRSAVFPNSSWGVLAGAGQQQQHNPQDCTVAGEGLSTLPETNACLLGCVGSLTDASAGLLKPEND